MDELNNADELRQTRLRPLVHGAAIANVHTFRQYESTYSISANLIHSFFVLNTDVSWNSR
jgi:hypothetical protein